jgi:hypothetical protein
LIAVCVSPVAGAQTDAEEALARVERSIPVNAVVNADWRCLAKGDSGMDVDAQIGRLRQTFEQTEPPSAARANAEASRPLYEHIRRGGLEVRERTYAWTPDGVSIEEGLSAPDGSHQHNLFVYANGASYVIAIHNGYAQVQAGDTVRSGSLAEQLFFCGVRVSRIVDARSLSALTRDGMLVLRATLDFHAESRSLPPGSTIEITADPAYADLPVALKAWVRGELRESATMRPGRFGGVAFPAEVKVTRYSRGVERLQWTIVPRDVRVGTASVGAPPRAPADLNVFDMRTPQYPAYYRLPAGDQFRTLEEARALIPQRRVAGMTPTGQLRLAGLLILGLVAIPTCGKVRARWRGQQ